MDAHALRCRRLAYTYTERDSTQAQREATHTIHNTEKERQYTAQRKTAQAQYTERGNTYKERDKEVRQTAQIQAFTGQ